MSNQPPSSNSNRPVEEWTKIEMIAKIKAYKFVLFKLHKEMEQKDEQIAELNKIIDRQQQSLNNLRK